MRLEAHDAVRPNDRVVAGPCRKVEPVADFHGDDVATLDEPESDRPGGDDKHLVVVVDVRPVTMAWTIRPAPRIEALGTEAGVEVRSHRRILAALDSAAMPGDEAPVLRYLSARDVERAMPPIDERLELAERAMVSLATAELPPKIAIHPRPDGSFAHVMPAHLRGDDDSGRGDLVGMKWIAGFPENRDRGLPALHGLVLLADPLTGVPLAVLDAGPITAQRTAAISGVAIAHFRPAVRSREPRAALIGAGVQGHSHLDVLGRVLPGVRLTVFDRHPDRAEELADAARATGGIGHAETAASAREATARADVVVTAAAFGQRRQVMTPDWLTRDALVVPVDYATYCSAVVARESALFVVDHREQFIANRDAGLFEGYPDPAMTLGDAISNGVPRPPVGRVVVTHLGVGLADLVFASAILERAIAGGRGEVLQR